MTRNLLLGVGGALFLAIAFAAGYAVRDREDGLDEPPPSTPPELAEPEVLEAFPEWELPDAPPPPPVVGWVASESVDEMRGTTTRLVCITAGEPLRLARPYSEATARFCFRHSPENGREAFFSLSEGQIVCSSAGCRVAVRFDDDEVREFRALPGSSTFRMLFITDADGFARHALTAERFIIEVEFYQSGRRQISFEHVDGLEWEVPPVRRERDVLRE